MHHRIIVIVLLAGGKTKHTHIYEDSGYLLAGFSSDIRESLMTTCVWFIRSPSSLINLVLTIQVKFGWGVRHTSFFSVSNYTHTTVCPCFEAFVVERPNKAHISVWSFRLFCLFEKHQQTTNYQFAWRQAQLAGIADFHVLNLQMPTRRRRRSPTPILVHVSDVTRTRAKIGSRWLAFLLLLLDESFKKPLPEECRNSHYAVTAPQLMVWWECVIVDASLVDIRKENSNYSARPPGHRI